METIETCESRSTKNIERGEIRKPNESNNFPARCNLTGTRVSAFREILQSLQCKIVQYTFLGQYLIKLQDFFSQCKIPHPAWLQLDHNKLGLSGMRLFSPQYHKTEKTLFQM